MKFIDILRDHLDAFNQAYDGQITASMRQAINAMLSCRTHTQRASHWACQGVLRQLTFRCHVVIAVVRNVNTTPPRIGWLNSRLNYCLLITLW
jgi:hypothetical protein